MPSPRTIERAGAVDSRMRTRPSALTPTAALSGIWGLLLIASVVTALYFGRSVFVPIALATLITFLLSRLVTRLERWIGRIAAVLVTVIAMFTIFAGASWVIGRQVIDLADRLPDYQANIVAKIRSLRLHAAEERRSSRPIDSSGGAGPYQHNHACDGRRWTSCVAVPFHAVPRQYVLRHLCCNWAAVYRSSKCRVVGS